MDLSALGAQTYAVWTRAAALRARTPGQIRGHLLDGDWQSPFPGVYCDGGIALDHSSWAWAAVLASLPRGAQVPRLDVVACARTAARLLGIPLIDDRDPATGAAQWLHHDVAVPRHARNLRSRKVGPDDDVHVLHRRQLDLTVEDLVVLDGLVVTDYERTLIDLAAVLSLEALACAIDWCLHEGKVELISIQTRVEARKGCEHHPRLAEAMALADGRAESCAETLARLILLPYLPGLEPQYEVVDRHGRVVARLDLADPELMLAVEPDGKRGHAGEVMVVKDRRRDAVTGGQYGWWTERVTWYELRRQQGAFRARVLARADKLRRRAA